jgi:hypothetical protein
VVLGTVFLVIKQPGHENDLSLPSVMNVTNAWSYISMPYTSSWLVFDLVLGQFYLYL